MSEVTLSESSSLVEQAKPVRSDRIKVPNQIILTDRWNQLEVYHYEDGTTDPQLFEFRGIVKDGDVVVCKTFGYSPEVLANDSEALTSQITPMLSVDGVRVYKSYEGTLLRLWNYAGTWHVSTHRKIDAFRSKWGHESSYGELFLRALMPTMKEKTKISSWADMDDEETSVSNDENIFAKYCNLLNKNKIYVFCLVTFKENRVICNATATEPTLYCIGAFDRSREFAYNMECPETGVPHPEEIKLEDMSIDNIVSAVQAMNPTEHQGVIIVTPDAKSGKVTNTENDRLMKLRGNQPNVVHRYVQLRWTPDLAEYVALYPEHKSKFDDWERCYKHIVHNILRKYIERFIRNNRAILPPEQYPVLEAAHKLYKNVLREKKEHVTEAHIDQILGTWQEREVNVLINKYREREALTGNGNRMPDSMRDGILTAIKGNKKQVVG